MRKPTPAFAIAVLALFVALAGTGHAVVNAAVPLARRALLAENAKKLNGQTARQLAKIPGPASTAAGVVTTRSKNVVITSGTAEYFTIDCDPNEKIISAGYASDTGSVLNLFLSQPSTERTWRLGFINPGNKTATTTLYAICIR
ncbi:MAG TPA: hypothetical protein VFP68_00755 [Burkholderiaceae bacterium]|nr:hypothetical protein [Burkholderiaceae bacterium]